MEPILRGEIFFADLHNSIGSEQAGQRPVIILQNDLLNENSPTTIVAPITSVLKNQHMRSHCMLPPGCRLHEPSMVLTEQLRTIDRRRLGAYIGRLQAQDIRSVEHALSYSLGLI